MTSSEADHNPLHLPSIADLPSDKIDELLDGIRERRFRAWQIYEQTQKDKQAVADMRARAALEKKLNQFKREYEQLTRKADKVERRALEIRGLRLQLGMEDTDTK